jgi:hypothetical protein
MKTAPIRRLSDQAKSIMNTIQKRNKPAPKQRARSSGKTIKIVFEEPKREEPKKESVWRM